MSPRFRQSLMGMVLVTPLLISTTVSTSSEAEEPRQLGSHVHGVTQLNMAVEAGEVYIEMISPAFNIVGFEHQPQDPEQEAVVQEALDILQAGADLFSFPEAAECSLSEANVETERDEADHTDHSPTDPHAEEQGKAEVHSEFVGTYRFDCQQPEQLDQVQVNLFTPFPGIEEIEMQISTETQQTSVELTPEETTLSL